MTVPLMNRLATPPACQKTATKWLVISSSLCQKRGERSEEGVAESTSLRVFHVNQKVAWLQLKINSTLAPLGIGYEWVNRI